MTQRPAFRSIPAPLTVDDETLDQINKTLGVPALVKPAAAPPVAQEAPKPPPLSSPLNRSTAAPSAKKTALPAGTLGPVERLHVELPGYVTDAMRMEAARTRTTMRHLVLKGLAAIGFAIEPGDLAPDDRRKIAKA